MKKYTGPRLSQPIGANASFPSPFSIQPSPPSASFSSTLSFLRCLTPPEKEATCKSSETGGFVAARGVSVEAGTSSSKEDVDITGKSAEAERNKLVFFEGGVYIFDLEEPRKQPIRRNFASATSRSARTLKTAHGFAPFRIPSRSAEPGQLPRESWAKNPVTPQASTTQLKSEPVELKAFTHLIRKGNQDNI
ncbi:hypothetical protein PIB30_043406 [Stylosanthes scabra]|uniref:Uncharacterized protein n=1 Tax=Stylosanthes scabra TaxID=79078 RepID=A0ABU6SGE1_9FABA|nr:hypothetical protein [Stylosanthes scabra]